MRKPLAGIFITGLIAGAAYLPLTLQLMLGSGFLAQTTQTMTFYFFPVCWAVLGLGFIFPRKFSERGFYFLAGALFLIFLGASLAMVINPDEQATLAVRLLVCWIPAGLLYFFIGQQMNEQLARAETRLHFGYGLFLAGLAAGGIFADRAVLFLGGDGLLLFMAAAAFALAFPGKIAAPAMAVAASLIFFGDADFRTERLRRVAHSTDLADPSFDLGESKRVAVEHLDRYATAFDRLAWNRRGQAFFYRHEKLGAYNGVINLQAEHQLRFVPEGDGRQVHHALFGKGQDILLIGVGSGRSISNMAIQDLGKNIFAVERDANTVRLMNENGINPNLAAVNYVAYDGRAFVEQSAKKWDWIVLESSVHQRNTSPFQLFQPYNLYTAEAFDSYFAHLKEGGTLVVEIAKPEDQARRTLAAAILNSVENLKASGAQTLSVRKSFEVKGVRSEYLLMHVRRGGAPLTPENLRIDPAVKRVGIDDYPERPCMRGYSDDSPFIDWMCMSRDRRGIILFYSYWLLALFVSAFIIYGLFFAHAGTELPLLRLIFISQSVAHCFLYLSVSYILRAAIQDEIATFYVFTFTTTLIAAAASFYTDRRLGRAKPIPAAPVAGAMAFGLIWLLLITRTDVAGFRSWPIRFALIAGAAGPFYFFSSLMFHVNLQRAKRIVGGVRQAFLFDSVALVPAYLVTPWILFDHGIYALFAAAAILYALMLGLAMLSSPNA